MRICILASAENVETVRQTAKEKLPDLANVPLLNMPVSASGNLPATHWFCNFKVSQEMCDRLIAAKELSIMEVTDDWKRFLEDQGLKLVRR